MASRRSWLVLLACCLWLDTAAAAAAEPQADAELYAFGRNNVGQLGLVDTEDRRRPTRVAILKPKVVTAVALGGSDQVDGHMMIIAAPGKLFVSGDNTFGQLGLGDYRDRNSLVPIPSLFGETFQSIAVGEAHSVALTTKGDIYLWGCNTRRQLALDDVTSQLNIPRRLKLPLSGLDKVVGICAGHWHSIAWTAAGMVFAWGDNTFGQLGTGEKKAHTGVVQAILPVALGGGVAATPAGSSARIRTIVCGGHHSILLTEGGQMYSWGRNNAGQLGFVPDVVSKDMATMQLLPVAAAGTLALPRVVAVCAGLEHSMLLTEAGEVYAFGDNSGGMLGVPGFGTETRGGNANVLSTPHPVGDKTLLLASVACGRQHTVGVTPGGKVYTWGLNTHGQLGLGTQGVIPQAEPVLVQELYTAGGGDQLKTVLVAAGASTSVAVLANGDMYGWGKANAGQLGVHATKLPHLRPEIILRGAPSAAPQGSSGALVIGSSAQGGSLLVTAGNEGHPALQGLSAGTSMRALAAGGYAYQYEGHSGVVLGSDDAVYTWGWNVFGQLGAGDLEATKPVPVRNPWLSRLKVTGLALGQFASAAVTESGELYTWGLNDCGQLGRGDFRSGAVEVPQRIHTDMPIVQVSVGYSFMLALAEDGRVYSWGRNFYGQLGLGDHKDRSMPTLVSYLQEERVVQVVAGQYHSLALTARGEVYAWGYNRDYELGVGDNMDRVLPQLLTAGLAGRRVSTVAAGGYHTLAVTDDGMLFSWGVNSYGQLGRRDKAPGKTPMQVAVLSGGGDSPSHPGGSGKRLRVRTVAAGTWHSLAITENGQLFSWGRCQYGQLGLRCHGGGDRAHDVFAPEPVEEFADRKAVARSAQFI
eukprot:jgi/Mesvir1/17513/Mv08769-RA.1